MILIAVCAPSLLQGVLGNERQLCWGIYWNRSSKRISDRTPAQTSVSSDLCSSPLLYQNRQNQANSHTKPLVCMSAHRDTYTNRLDHICTSMQVQCILGIGMIRCTFGLKKNELQRAFLLQRKHPVFPSELYLCSRLASGIFKCCVATYATLHFTFGFSSICERERMISVFIVDREVNGFCVLNTDEKRFHL